MKQPKDKRTKEYKEWKAKYNEGSKGLGDDIKSLTTKIGVDKVISYFTDGEDCGCDDRQEILNKLFPNEKPKCFTEKQYNDWVEFINRKNKNDVTHKEQLMIIGILKTVFNSSLVGCSTCSPSVWNGYIDKINLVYDEYR